MLPIMPISAEYAAELAAIVPAPDVRLRGQPDDGRFDWPKLRRDVNHNTPYRRKKPHRGNRSNNDGNQNGGNRNGGNQNGGNRNGGNQNGGNRNGGNRNHGNRNRSYEEAANPTLGNQHTDTQKSNTNIHTKSGHSANQTCISQIAQKIPESTTCHIPRLPEDIRQHIFDLAFGPRKQPAPPCYYDRLPKQIHEHIFELAFGPKPQPLKCHLFRLPAEIRNKIYDMVIGPTQTLEIRCLTRKRGLTYSSNTRNPHGVVSMRHGYLIEAKVADRREEEYRRKYDLNTRIRRARYGSEWVTKPSSNGIASLLLVCRTFYDESIAMFYARHIFSIDGRKTLDRFIGTVAEDGRDAIQALVLNYQTPGHPQLMRDECWKEEQDRKWLYVCNNAAIELVGLRRLSVKLRLCDVPLQLNMGAKWVQPLRAFANIGITDFQMSLCPRWGEEDSAQVVVLQIGEMIMGEEWNWHQERQVVWWTETAKYNPGSKITCMAMKM